MVGVKQGKFGEGVDNHTHNLISESGIVENIYGVSTSALITADLMKIVGVKLLLLTKTQCELLIQAAVQVWSQDEKMYSKKGYLH